MSPRKLGGRREEPQDLFRELMEEAHLDEQAPDREEVPQLEDTLPPAPETAEEASVGYEEFAEVPTGGYTGGEGPYMPDEETPAYSAPEELTGGERRSRRGRAESRTAPIPQVPLKTVKDDDVRELQEDEKQRRRRRARQRSRLLAWVFCVFIFGLLILFCAMPKTYFSNEERSVLAAEPTFSPRTVFDGSFEEDAETYVSDHFPFRTFWVGLNSYYNLASGRQLINEVYVGRDGYLMQEPTVPDEKKLSGNMHAVRTFLEERRLPASFLAVPSAGFIMDDMLPEVHLPYQDREILQAAEQQLAGSVRWIDVTEDLRAESAVEQVYYRTDHHWTTLGAYIGYIRWAQMQGVEPTPVDRFRISFYDGFRGTTYAKVLLWNVKPDMIQLWESGGSYTVEMSDGNEAPVTTDTFYDIPALSGYDPYMVFFGGNHGLMHIRNNDAAASGSLLLIKDSYANSFIPFIAPHYADIYVVDPRYYKNLRGLCDSTALDEVLFVYGTGNLVNDQDLGLIDM